VRFRCNGSFSPAALYHLLGVAGPWASDVLAEDARRLAAFKRSREGVPWDEVEAWMRIWGTPQERPTPSSREL
jgi:hypothetical protein